MDAPCDGDECAIMAKRLKQPDERLRSAPSNYSDRHIRSGIARADRVIATSKDQAIQDEQGDLFEPVGNGIISWDEISDLGELVAGKVTGRNNDDEITVFKQNSDQGVGFMALAALAYDKATAAGIGIEI